jgi:hypothetical protein
MRNLSALSKDFYKKVWTRGSNVLKLSSRINKRQPVRIVLRFVGNEEQSVWSGRWTDTKSGPPRAGFLGRLASFSAESAWSDTGRFDTSCSGNSRFGAETKRSRAGDRLRYKFPFAFQSTEGVMGEVGECPTLFGGMSASDQRAIP